MNPKNSILMVLAVASFASGVANQYFYPGIAMPLPAVVFTILGALLIFAWYRLDANQIGYKRSPWLNVGVIGLAIISLPYYFLRSRGAKRGFVAIGIMLLALVALNFLSVAGSYAVYYALQS